jgi:hypothetical protein
MAMMTNCYNHQYLQGLDKVFVDYVRVWGLCVPADNARRIPPSLVKFPVRLFVWVTNGLYRVVRCYCVDPEHMLSGSISILDTHVPGVSLVRLVVPCSGCSVRIPYRRRPRARHQRYGAPADNDETTSRGWCLHSSHQWPSEQCRLYLTPSLVVNTGSDKIAHRLALLPRSPAAPKRRQGCETVRFHPLYPSAAIIKSSLQNNLAQKPFHLEQCPDIGELLPPRAARHSCWNILA